jgi:hypothetical protein
MIYGLAIVQLSNRRDRQFSALQVRPSSTSLIVAYCESSTRGTTRVMFIQVRAPCRVPMCWAACGARHVLSGRRLLREHQLSPTHNMAATL